MQDKCHNKIDTLNRKKRNVKSRQQQIRRRKFTWRLGLFKACKKRDVKPRQQQTL